MSGRIIEGILRIIRGDLLDAGSWTLYVTKLIDS